MTTFSTGFINIATLYQMSGRVLEIPEFQREEVWSLSKQQLLIDSVLRGIPIPAIILAKNETLMGTKQMIVDGQQRLRALFDFIDCKFKTSNRMLEPKTRAIEPNRTYKELSPASKDSFDLCLIPTMTVNSDDPIDLGVSFRRWNNSEPLKFAEKLYAVNRNAVLLSEKIQEHPFFGDIYKAKGRRQIFQVTAHMFILERSDSGFVNSTNARLEDAVASIDSDSQGLCKSICRRLDYACNLFYGYEFSAMGEVIPIYQSVIFLEQDGYKLDNLERGILTPWMMKQKEFAVNVSFSGRNITIYKLFETNHQRKFWSKELSEIFAIVGQEPRDNKRLFSNAQKISAYNRQNGVCPVCREKLSIRDNGHHMIPHSDGGKTDQDNCILVHEDCHKKITRGDFILQGELL